MGFKLLVPYLPLFLQGTGITISISFLALIIGFVVGLIACLMRLAKSKPLNIIGGIYVEVIRDTPLLVQLMLFYYGLPSIGIALPTIGSIPKAFTAGAFVLSINSGAYIAELMRSGIQSVDSGQTEASRSLGMNYWQTMRFVVIPQAVKNILPAIANEFVALVKESSIMYFIGIKDLMAVANIAKNGIFQAFPAYILAAVIYFVITFTLSKLIGMYENKLKKQTSR